MITALHFGAGDLDLRLTDGGELTEAYSVEKTKNIWLRGNICLL